MREAGVKEHFCEIYSVFSPQCNKVSFWGRGQKQTMTEVLTVRELEIEQKLA